MRSQTWSRRQALGIPGVLNSAAGTWKARYDLRLEAEGEDQRARHPFSDILRLKLVKELVDLDIASRRACAIANDHFDAIGAIDPDSLDNHHQDGPYIVVRHVGLPQRTVAEMVETLGAAIDVLRMPGTAGVALIIDLTMLAWKVVRLIKTTTRPEEAAEDFSLPLEERARATWDGSPKIQEEFGEDGLEAYLAYRKALEAGLISSD